MKFLDILQTARANMRRNKGRTSLTILAIFVGALTFTLTNGIGDGIKSYLDRQVGNLGAENVMLVTAKNLDDNKDPTDDSPTPYDENRKQTGQAGVATPGGATVFMNQNDLESIKNLPDVQDVKIFRFLLIDYIASDTSEKYQAMADELYGEINLDMASGRRTAFDGPNKELTIPKNYVKALGFSSPEDAVGKTVNMQVRNLAGDKKIVTGTIVGVQEKTLIGATSTFVSPALANEIYAFQTEGLPRFATEQYAAFFVFHPTDLPVERTAELKNTLGEKGYKAQTIQEQTAIVFSVINGIIIVFNGFGAIALIAASFGIMNTLLMSVQERTKEIGLMKALGMSKRKIFVLFSIEAILLGFWGSALGIIVAQILGKIASVVATRTFLKDLEGLILLSFPAIRMVGIALGIMFVAFLAGTIPARRAAKKDPIEALRYE